jgi:hypothetical protein
VSRLEEIAAYLGGELDGAAADAFEEALFDAPDDPDVQFVDTLARRGARLAEHGTFYVGVLKRELDALIAKGHTVQICDGGHAGTRTPVVMDDSEFFATKLVLGRSDVERVDVETHVAALGITKTIRDVIVDRSDGTVYGLCERPLAQIAYGHGLVIATVRAGDEVLGTWEFDSAR